MAAIPIEQCLTGRDVSEPRLHPDGERVMYAVSAEGETSLVLHQLGDDTIRVITGVMAPRVGRGLGGGCWCWSADGTAVVYAGVDGNLWRQALDAGSPQRLTDHGPERAAQAPVAVPDGSRLVYVVDQAEVWSIGVDGDDAQRLDDGSADFCFDPWPMPCSSGVVWLAWNVPDMPWDRARTVRRTFDRAVHDEFVPPLSMQQPRVLPDGRGIAIQDDHGWNNVWIDDAPLVDESFEHAGPTWGLGQRSYCWSPDGRYIAFTRNEAGFGRLCVADGAGGRVVPIGRGVHGQLSWEANRLCAVRTGARTPTEVVVYEHDEDPLGAWQRRRLVQGPDPAWSTEHLVEPEAVVLAGADGGPVHARLYRADTDPARPVDRLICWVHGGPTDQWQVTFLPRVAFWRSRGYHVLVVDHRGSTGHGRRYQQALRGRWGELDVADVVAAVHDAHRRGWATPASTVLIGGSAGGFTVLGALRADPGLVAAAVLAYPVADLADLAERSHRFERHYTVSLVGDPSRPAMAALYRDRSPVWFVDRITTPLLVFHGDVDPVVPVTQSKLLAERVRTAGGSVELHVYPGEGHGFRQRQHQRDEYERTEAFLSRHVR